MARLRRDSAGKRLKRFGSKLGTLAIATISPDQGSSSTAVPDRAPASATATASSRSTANWTPESIDSSSVAPSSGGRPGASASP